MKKLLLVLLALAMILAFAACTSDANVDNPDDQNVTDDANENDAEGAGMAVEDIKVGHIHFNDESEQGYSTSHINGINAMKETLGLSDEQVIGKYNISADSACADAIQELIDAGCNIIFADSFGFEDYMLEAAKEYPDIQFCHATGFQALDAGLSNFHNYFGNIYEAHYLCGIVAGLTTKTNKLGCVSAMHNTECISGFTAFYLGAKSVNPDVTLDVIYINSWFDMTLEAQSAQALIDRGCDVICQHTDSTAVQTTCEAAGVYCIAYNTDLSGSAPNYNLCSAVWDWSAVYIGMMEAFINGEEIATDYSGDLADGMVNVVYNEAVIPADVKAAAEEAKQKIIDGELYPYVVGPFTGTGVDAAGNEVTIDLAEGEEYHEPQSAPQWGFILPGITIVE